MGGLLPLGADQPKFAQLYIYDAELALSYQTRANNNLLAGTLGELENILRGCNPYIRQYKSGHDLFASKPPEEQNDISAKLLWLQTPTLGYIIFPLLWR